MMIKGVLFDIGGVLHEDWQPIPGAVDAVNRLLADGLPLRFVTNTSRATCADLLHRLNTLGVAARAEEVFTAPLAVKQACITQGLRPYCLVHPELEAEFADLEQRDPNAVILADAAERFDYAHLNRAFSLLLAGAPLLGIGRNRYFKSGGRLVLDAGPFIRALEYAAGVEARILGKPAAAFFHAATSSLGCQPAEVMMIGDDVEADVLGALDAGLQACLVRTGKYLPGDDSRAGDAMLADSVVTAIDALLLHGVRR